VVQPLVRLALLLPIWFAFTQDVDQTIREGVVKQGLKIEQVTK